jgi:GNAT superfamily N-acetyltransferase
MREHVEKHYEWNPNLFSQNFQSDEYTIVQLNGDDIGFFKVVEESNGLYLADMMIAPDHQGHGNGGNVIDHIVSRGRPIRLQVLKSSPARHLYERKGFNIIDEIEHHFKMERAV